MPALFARPSILIPVAMLVGVVALWQSPLARLTLMLILLLSSAVMALASVLAKHRKAYREGGITPGLFARNVLAEMAFLLLAMVLAGLLGRYIAHAATRQIGDEFLKFVAGIAAGLLAGTGVGLVMHLLWRRLARTS